MVANDNQISDSQSNGCAYELIWFVKGFFQPLYRLDFYRQAMRRKVFPAIAFFVVFGALLALVSTISFMRVMSTFTLNIGESFEKGEIPEIVIEDGIASVNAPQPYVISDDEDSIYVLDTTGEYQRIDTSRYSQGILLTRDELHILNRTRYQIMKLSDLQTLLSMNPLVIDQESAVRLWQGFSAVIGIVFVVMYGFWDIIVWFIFLCLLALIMMGAATLMFRRAEYGELLILGIYAFVPASYIALLLGLINIRFFGLKTLILLGIWGVVVNRLTEKKEQSDLTVSADKGVG